MSKIKKHFQKCLAGGALTLLLSGVLGVGALQAAVPASANPEWLNCLYVAGANLESAGGYWNANAKALETGLPMANQAYLVGFGGAKNVQNATLKSFGWPKQPLLLLHDKGWTATPYTLNAQDMGAQATFQTFLTATQAYAANRRNLIIWGNGKGSLIGAPQDENTQHYLSLNDTRAALQTVYGANAAKPAFDVTLYDAGCMCSLETLNTLQGMTKYFIGSADAAPDGGYNYAALAKALKAKPTMSTEELVQSICNDFVKATVPTEDGASMSLAAVDMSKVEQINQAYKAYLQEVLGTLQNDPTTATMYMRYAYKADHYTDFANSTESDQVDLADLAMKTREFAPLTADALYMAVDKALPFYALGQNHSYAGGLSVYFPLSGSLTNLQRYSELAVAEPAAVALAKTVLEQDYGVSKLQQFPVQVHNEALTCQLTQADINKLVAIEGNVYMVKNDKRYLLGNDNRLQTNWTTGAIQYPIPTTWFHLNGHLVPCKTVASKYESRIFLTPLQVNGEDCYLSFHVNSANNAFEILGVDTRKDNVNYSDYYKKPLKVGDKVCVRYPYLDAQGGLHYDLGAPFVLGSTPTIANAALVGGNYEVSLTFRSARGHTAQSQAAAVYLP